MIANLNFLLLLLLPPLSLTIFCSGASGAEAKRRVLAEAEVALDTEQYLAHGPVMAPLRHWHSWVKGTLRQEFEAFL
jgi:hypothetical protein